MNAATTITIRDYSTVNGGGYAVTHLASCEKVARPSVGHIDMIVEDSRYRTTVARAEKLFRNRFTVAVEVRRCACAQAHVDAVAAEAERLDAIDRAERHAEDAAEAAGYLRYLRYLGLATA